MEKPSEMPNPLEVQDALMHIEQTKAMLRQYGNDPNSEYEALNDIASQLHRCALTPAEAKGRADAFFNSKNFR